MFFPKEDLEAFCCHLVLLPGTLVLACSFVAFLVFQYELSVIYTQKLVGGPVSGFYITSFIFWAGLFENQLTLTQD